MHKWISKALSIVMVLALAGSVYAASPPFDIDITKPGDSDIVSSHPAQARSFRDIVESWLLTDHDNTTGHHDQVFLVDNSTDPTPASTEVGIWNNGSRLFTRVGSGGVESFNGVPVGTVVDWAGQDGASAPNGWFLTYGQCVSRTTYAALFAVLGTTYDNGCAGTDFGIPDTRGRVVAGEDDMGGVSANRLTNADDGLNGDTVGATGGGETQVLAETNLAAHNHGVNINDPGHTHTEETVTGTSSVSSGGGGTGIDTLGPQASGSSSTGITATSDNTGSGTAFGIVQPTLVLQKIIKY